MKRRIPTVITDSKEDNINTMPSHASLVKVGVVSPAQAANTPNMGTMDRYPLTWLDNKNPFLMTICHSTSDSSVTMEMKTI